MSEADAKARIAELEREVSALRDALHTVAFVVRADALLCTRCGEWAHLHQPARCEVAAALGPTR